jgi:hypothetical protein
MQLWVCDNLVKSDMPLPTALDKVDQMEAIAQLEHEYLCFRLGYNDGQPCVDWAEERLRLDQEGDDLDIVHLASARGQPIVASLVEIIIERYCGIDHVNDEFVGGKFVAVLHSDYLQGRESVDSLDHKFTRLFARLGYPNWMVMLSRNCEYATDVPEFKEPFELEFAYVASLWAAVATKAEFDAKYSRKISDQHDAAILRTGPGT